MNPFFALLMLFFILPVTVRSLFGISDSVSMLFCSFALFLCGAIVWQIIQFFRRRAKRRKKARQQQFLSQYVFHKNFRLKLSSRYPQLNEQDWLNVEEAMRQYFRIHIYMTGKDIGMPSRMVDDYWHEFILHTRSYALFCQGAFGRFIHHTPASMMDKNHDNEALRRAWRGACKDQNLSPKQISVLPLLFAIDADLKISNGFIHNPALLLAVNTKSDSDCSSGGSCGSSGCTSGSGNSACGSDSSCSSCGSGCGGGGD